MTNKMNRNENAKKINRNEVFRTAYTPEFKEKISKAINNGANASEIANKYGLAPAMVYKWAKQYSKHSFRQRKVFTPENKVKIIKDFLENNLRPVDIQKKYGVRPDYLARWVRQYKNYMSPEQEDVYEEKNKTNELSTAGCEQEFCKEFEIEPQKLNICADALPNTLKNILEGLKRTNSRLAAENIALRKDNNEKEFIMDDSQTYWLNTVSASEGRAKKAEARYNELKKEIDVIKEQLMTARNNEKFFKEEAEKANFKIRSMESSRNAQAEKLRLFMKTLNDTLQA